MQSGKLRYRITLRNKTTEADEIGQPIETWADLATVWADVRFLNGKEFITANKESAQDTASIRIRKRDVSTDWRVLFDGKTYEITAALPTLNYVDIAVKEWQE